MRAGIFASARVAPTGVVTQEWVQASPTQEAGNASLTIANAITTGDVFVAIDIGNYAATSEHGTAMAGLGATWTREAAAQSLVSEVWIGVAGSNLPSGEVVTLTAPALAPASRRRLIVFCFRGTTATVTSTVASATSATATATDTAGSGQAVVAFGYGDSAANSLKSLTPSGWASISTLILNTGRYTGFSSRIPSSTVSHSASASRLSGVTFVTVLVVG